LAAGRELDALVAKKVMGLHGIGYYGPNKSHGFHRDYDRFDTNDEALAAYKKYWPEDSWHEDEDCLHHWKDDWGPLCLYEYSTDIFYAWLVVEKMQEDGWYWGIGYDYGELVAGFYTARDSEGEVDPYFVQAKTAPLAICLAALKAVGEEE